jgi:hypothetical protein
MWQITQSNTLAAAQHTQAPRSAAEVQSRIQAFINAPHILPEQLTLPAGCQSLLNRVLKAAPIKNGFPQTTQHTCNGVCIRDMHCVHTDKALQLHQSLASSGKLLK